MRKVLAIAYHFPPLAGSSGVQRTLRFVQHLPSLGWQPLVLTTHVRAYEQTSADLEAEIPVGTVVRRAFALDAARHLSIGGRYIGALARPDRWSLWRFAAVREGMKMIREYRPDAIWSTFPIATAHRIAAELHRRSKIPWIADFRDPMAQDGYPQDPIVWAQYKAIEENAMVNASYCTFTTPTATLSHQNRYAFAADRIRLLENGYDEESFASVEAGANSEPLNPGALTLLHSGIVYPEERDPTQLFEALRSLKDKGLVAAGSLRIRFRAAVQVELLRRLASQHGVGEFIEVMPSISYKPALAEMLRADALLVMQGSNCNEQVPAKVYEYIRANRPIVCLADPAGDTATVLRNSGIKLVARLDSVTEIEGALMRLLSPGNKSYQQVPTGSAVQQASRRQRSKGLAALLDSIK